MSLKTLIFTPVIFAILICTIAADELKTEPKHTTEEEAREFVIKSNEDIFKFLDIVKGVDSVKTPDPVTAGIFLLVSYTQMMLAISDMAKKARSYPRAQIQDDQLKRDLDILSNPGLLSLDTNGMQTYTDLKLQNDELSNILCSYENKSNCEIAQIPDIRERLEQSLNGNELQYYWEEWRNKHRSAARDRFKMTVKLFLNASEIAEKTPIEFWYSNYEGSSIANYMEDVMKQIKPFYAEFHAYIRSSLRTQFGESVVPLNGAIPHHLIEKILADSNFIPQPYPTKLVPHLKERLGEKYLNAKNLVEFADDFFKSMGFPSLSDIFWSSDFKQKTIKRKHENDCKNKVFVNTPSIGFRYCPNVNFGNYLQIHNDMARLYYASEKNELPYTQFQSFRLDLAVGKAAVFAASSPKHIKRIGILQNYTYYEQSYMNQIFQKGLKTMFSIPLNFVHNKFMSEIFSRQLEFGNINKRYWELMEEYAGIKPPSPRSEMYLDFPPDFTKDLWDNDFTIKFVNEILGYQFYRSLCKKGGEYIQYSVSHHLSNCDFSSSSDAGQSLRRMMSLGGKKTWKKVLREVIDDEPIINGEALLEFYQPLIDWLKAENKLNKVRIGWSHRERKVGNSD